MNHDTPTYTPNDAATSTPVRTNRAMAAALWASAFVLAALILVRAGDTPEPPPVAADMVASTGDFQMMTTAGATNGELLYVLDSRSERLVVYSLDSSRDLTQRASVDLPRLFAGARGGGRRP